MKDEMIENILICLLDEDYIKFNKNPTNFE
jgi:hypothetical protein